MDPPSDGLKFQIFLGKISFPRSSHITYDYVICIQYLEGGGGGGGHLTIEVDFNLKQVG